MRIGHTRNTATTILNQEIFSPYVGVGEVLDPLWLADHIRITSTSTGCLGKTRVRTWKVRLHGPNASAANTKRATDDLEAWAI